MSLIITGAAGFIGSHFLNAVFENSNILSIFKEVKVVDNLTYASDLKFIKHLKSKYNFECFEKSIADRDSMTKIIKPGDTIVNFAAESHVDNSLEDASLFIESNVFGVGVLLEVSKNVGVDKFVQISTDEVYGSTSLDSWDENSGLDPNSPYSATKASADLLSIAYFRSHGIPLLITRSSNNYGPRQHQEKFIPKVINQVLLNKTIPVYGNGENIRDWLFVEDNVSGIINALLKGNPGEIYNLGGGNEYTNLDMINKISEILKRPAKIEFVPDRKAHDFRYSISSEKAKKELDYTPTYSLEIGLEKTIHYFKQE
jgi:dTDP-glucose 4,6-dehydratase